MTFNWLLSQSLFEIQPEHIQKKKRISPCLPSISTEFSSHFHLAPSNSIVKESSVHLFEQNGSDLFLNVIKFCGILDSNFKCKTNSVHLGVQTVETGIQNCIIYDDNENPLASCKIETGKTKMIDHLLACQNLCINPYLCVDSGSTTIELAISYPLLISNSIPMTVDLFQYLSVLYGWEQSTSSNLPAIIDPEFDNLGLIDLCHPDLISTLLPYQEATVKWLLSREGISINEQRNLSITPIKIPAAYIQITSNPNIYVSLADCSFTSSVTVEKSRPVSGGILCDEMGLGKTIMLLSLVLFHSLQNTPLLYNALEPPLIKTTLVITPSVIKAQWIQEITKHTKQLIYYELNDNTITTEQLSKYDVILISYQFLEKEFYASRPGRDDMPRRNNRPHFRRTSPLIGVTWWRVILDESQMIESNSSNVSEMAKSLPRIHAWAVTGTPTPKTGKLEDMHGLFRFLKIPSFSNSLQQFPNSLLQKTLEVFVHRTMKDGVKDQLVLPKQSQVVIYLNFSTVEYQYYSDLKNEALELIGSPISYDVNNVTREQKMAFEKQIRSRIANMKLWLLRLRQTCCHPQIASENRKVLGGRVQTIDEVLKAMIEKAYASILTHERELILNLIERAHLDESRKQFDCARDVYDKQLLVTQTRIEDLEKRLKALDAHNQIDDEINDDETNAPGRMKARLRIWKELEHSIYFFQASNFHNDSNETEDETLKLSLRQKETDLYEIAAKKRRALLMEYEQFVETIKSDTLKDVSDHDTLMAESLLTPVDLSGGIVTGPIFEDIEIIEDALNEQMNLLCVWRVEAIKLLTSPLEVDDDMIDPTGDEYEVGIIQQESLMAFQDEMACLLCDRRKLLLGTVQKYPVQSTFRTDFKKKLKEKRLKFDLKDLSYKLLLGKLVGLSDRQLPLTELKMIKLAINHMKVQMANESQILNKLEREITGFRDLFNARVKYFTQLNKISDSVAFPEWTEPADVVEESLRAEAQRLNKLIATCQGRHNYFNFLAKSSNKGQESNGMICITCQSQILKGSLTECGHIFCNECCKAWIIVHKKCAICNNAIDIRQLFQITLSPSDYPHIQSNGNDNNADLLREIMAVKIKGSFGTKFDTITKHVRLLLEKDPSVKMLFFSQWSLVLEILGRALEENSIGFTSIEGYSYNPFTNRKVKKNKSSSKPVTEFCENPHISALLLNAKSQSSGLTLIAATHVFLIEPMLQKGPELQAINRVHRIGQTKPTFVWRYLINDTVEIELERLSHHLKDTVTKLQKKDQGEYIKDEQLDEFFR
ncbi:SNF2 family N-terminal domain-containing protein [Globomyces pollinis-pini]|nr:SNF2 family N-terminal domain-containing protein [Globomyces pollinis-pini]